MAWQQTQQAADRTAESFHGLLLRHRGRSGLTQRQLAVRVGVSRGSVQDWEAGLNYPDAQHLQALIVTFLEADGLTLGCEATEAEALWDAALRTAARMQTPFDAVWWARLLAMRGESEKGESLHGQEAAAGGEPSAGRISERRQDWGEAPDVLGFVGRAEELRTLREWVLGDRCRLVAILGMGGIGKTAVAARLAQDLVPSFERLYWRSLRDALPIMEWLGWEERSASCLASSWCRRRAKLRGSRCFSRIGLACLCSTTLRPFSSPAIVMDDTVTATLNTARCCKPSANGGIRAAWC